MHLNLRKRLWWQRKVLSLTDSGQMMKPGDTFVFSACLAKADGLAMSSLLVSNTSGNRTDDGSNFTRVVGMNAEKRAYENPGSWV